MVKYVLRHVVLAILVILGLYLNIKGFEFIFKETKSKTVTSCGVVVSTLPGQRETKHRLVDELYLGVKFDSGKFEAVEVSPTTFLNKNIGDKVCFDNVIKPEISLFKDMIGFTGMIVIIMEIMVGGFFFFEWLFNNEED